MSQGQHGVFWYFLSCGALFLLHTFLPTTHIFSYVVLISVYAPSYTKMQLWWWEGLSLEGLSLCLHQDETLMLGCPTLWCNSGDGGNIPFCSHQDATLMLWGLCYAWGLALSYLIFYLILCCFLSMCFPTLRCNSGDRRDFPFFSHQDVTLMREMLAVPQGQHSVSWYFFFLH